MAEPLTVNEAKNFLRVENSGDDTLIAALIETARLQVEAATGRILDQPDDPAPAPLVHAIRLLVAHWYEQRNLDTADTIGIPLPVGVHALIAPYRELRL